MNYPKTIKEASIQLVKDIEKEDTNALNILKNTPKKNLINYHHTLGRWIRNNYGLWENNKELKENKHPDDVSQEIIIATWKKLNEEKSSK